MRSGYTQSIMVRYVNLLLLKINYSLNSLAHNCTFFLTHAHTFNVLDDLCFQPSSSLCPVPRYCVGTVDVELVKMARSGGTWGKDSVNPSILRLY
jgi:hypothetical protein